MIKLKNVGFNASKRDILKNINLEIKPGERVAILGPNGCGKTTLVNVITENIKLTSGEMDLGDLKHLSKDKICYMMQHEELHKDMKVKEAIELFSSHNNKEKSNALLQEFGLSERANSLYRKLSGGEKQKLNLVCSLQNDPQYFFVDEITTGLDAMSRKQLIEHFLNIIDESKTFVMITHYLEEAEQACNRFVFIKNGMIIADMSKAEMTENAHCIFTLYDGEEIVVKEADAEAYMKENFAHIMKYEAKGNMSLENLFEKLYEKGDDNDEKAL